MDASPYSMTGENIPDTPNTLVTLKYFLEGFGTVFVKRRLTPKNLSSIFPNIQKSLIPTPPPPPRSKKSSFLVRCHLSEEFDEFTKKKDNVDFVLFNR
ncbi:hypothetical protein PoB_002300500 [Plakobranchus ocellatus]|uniref:Uncharacterized protein n=1 Tax=Plakobranchus ocellatus TaxID=259542 RepID=A0AAV3ZLF1_9GAST|nr:hypothetical protein PoB_002300500 [Plakobranchus ocellatus]